MSISYLKDLVETTHVFLKLMECMAKSKHLMVRSKKMKKKRPNPAKKAGNIPPGVDGDLHRQQTNEDICDKISSQLSSYLQGSTADLPNNISPFDAASDIPIDDQKLLAMFRLQD